MENIASSISVALIASFLSVFLTYLFVLPRLPGVSFTKTPWLFALITAVAQTISTTLFLLFIGYPALYMGLMAGISGQGKGAISLLEVAAAFFAFLAWWFSLIYIVAGERLSHGSMKFGRISRPSSALLLTFIQVVFSCGACYTALWESPKVRWGYIDKTGKFVIPPKYQFVDQFQSGSANVTLPDDFFGTPGKTFFIDHGGATIEGLVRREDSWKREVRHRMDDDPALYEAPGQYSTGGNVIEIKGDQYLPFSEDLAAVKPQPPPGVDGLAPIPNELWGFANRKFKLAIKPTYSDIRSFKEGLAAASTNKKWGYIDHKGHWVIQPKFTSAESFCDGLASVRLAGQTEEPNAKGKAGYIDKKGNFVIPPTFNSCESFSEGLAAAAVETKQN